MKRFTIALAVALGLAAAAGASAQEAGVAATTSAADMKVRAEVRAEARVGEPRPLLQGAARPMGTTTRPEPMGTSSRPGEIRARIEDRRQDTASSTATATGTRMSAEARAQVAERLQANFSAKVEMAAERLEKAVARLEEILAKIESRTAKIAEGGADVSSITSALVDAKVKIEAAKGSVSAVSQVTASEENPRGSLETLRQVAKVSQDSIKEAHQALVAAIESIKKGQLTE